MQKLTSDSLVEDFVNLQHDEIGSDSVTALNNFRVNRQKNIIFGHFNINFIRNKFKMFKIDVLMVSESN